MKKISVIILNYNTAALTQKAISQLRQSEPNIDWEIILIDNGSKERISETAFDDAKIKFVYNRENAGFAKAVNQGLAMASHPQVLLLNSDVLVESGAISALSDYLESHSSAGMIGPQFFYPHGRFQVSAGFFPSFGGEFVRLFSLYKIFPYSTFIYKNVFSQRFFSAPRKVDWLSGGCLLIKKEVIEAIGGLDEKYFFGVEDVDFCFRARQAGWETVYFPAAHAIHYHGYSSGGTNTKKRLLAERGGWLYFLKKNLPRRIFTRFLVEFAYFFRLALARR